MILHIDSGRWYIDVRTTETSEQMSYDLVLHLPRRLEAGRVVVLTENTKVFLSVIRKRWMKLLREVECQRSSTLNAFKKEALQFEATQMRSCRFASKPPPIIPNARVYCLTPDGLPADFPSFMTLYITVPLSAEEIANASRSLSPGGLVVIYGPWLPHYEALLKQTYAH